MFNLNIIYCLFTLFYLVNSKIIYKGSGDITYYYNVGNDPCKLIDNPSDLFDRNIFTYQNEGYPECDINGYKNLSIIGKHNNIIAIPNRLLNTIENKKKFCGKQLNLYINNKKVRFTYPLIVQDGCEECNNNGGIDISTTLLYKIFGMNGCKEGRISNITTNMKYYIIDKQIIEYTY